MFFFYSPLALHMTNSLVLSEKTEYITESREVTGDFPASCHGQVANEPENSKQMDSHSQMIALPFNFETVVWHFWERHNSRIRPSNVKRENGSLSLAERLERRWKHQIKQPVKLTNMFKTLLLAAIVPLSGKHWSIGKSHFDRRICDRHRSSNLILAKEGYFPKMSNYSQVLETKINWLYSKRTLCTKLLRNFCSVSK